MRALFIIACLVATASVGAAHGDNVDITIAARESECGGGATFCFEITSGDPGTIAAGSSVHLTFVNEGASVHNAYVADGGDADPDRRDTDESAAIARTSEFVDEGGQEDVEFVVPASASSLYVWCDVAGHEQLGMFIEWPVQGDAATGAGHDDGGTTMEDGGAVSDAGDEASSTPLPWLVLVVALVVATVGRRQR